MINYSINVGAFSSTAAGVEMPNNIEIRVSHFKANLNKIKTLTLKI